MLPRATKAAASAIYLFGPIVRPLAAAACSLVPVWRHIEGYKYWDPAGTGQAPGACTLVKLTTLLSTNTWTNSPTMAGESSFLSQTLQSITLTKVREQSKRRKAFEARKTQILETADAAPDEHAKLQALLSGFKEHSSGNKGVWYIRNDRKNTIENMGRYLEQSYRDPSVSSAILHQFGEDLRQKLNQESERFNFADLYYRLLAEWTGANNKPIADSEEKEEDLGGSFEHVQKYNLQNLKEKFSSVVFTPLETDAAAIDAYLSSLFEDDYAQTSLKRIRERVAQDTIDFKANPSPFTQEIVKQCIQALLTNDLLNDEAKMTLNEFLPNGVVLDEIADVLNLRFQDIDNWSWEADDGLFYEPRRQPNGKYRIMMDQDILQAIFLHYIAVTWSSRLKGHFRLLVCDRNFWKEVKPLSQDARSRRKFFAGNLLDAPNDGIVAEEMKTFRRTFLLSSMPQNLSDTADPYGGDTDSDDEPKSGLGIRQLLLRQIATNVIIRRALHGDVAVVQSDLQWYATGLPHSTLFAVLRFWGIPEDWITFFRKFAEAPLRMDATPGQSVRIRKRGIPITDAFEKFFGETVLFGMDIAVNRLSDMTLFRFHDDLFLTGEPSKCASAWGTIQDFVKVLGLDINTSKTGSVYISDKEKDAEVAAKFPKGSVSMGMLQLTDTGDWVIDQKQVSAHVRQLQKQLGQCTSVISWVLTWNACMGSFFQNTFGKPANCFGQAHVESILDTFAKMQRELFESHNGSVTQYLRDQISQRFGVGNIPDSFFFLSDDLGGLELQNPFIPFFVLKDQLEKNPSELISNFLQESEQRYKDDRKEFEALSDSEKERRFKTAFNGTSKYKAILDEPFLSFEEYTAKIETYSWGLKSVYKKLMQKPDVKDIQPAHATEPWFVELSHSHEMGWKELSSKDKWIMHLYAEELKQRFGALSIVDRNLLPSGLMKMLKGKKVVWQLIIWD